MTTREFIVMLVMCTIWGFHFVVIKLGVSELPPLFYAAIRMTLLAIVLSPFLRWRPGQMKFVFIAGLCLGGLNYAFMFSGIARTTASASALVIELYVPFATILSVVVLGETVGMKRIAGIALAVLGVMIIAISRDSGAEESAFGLGVVLVACGAMCEAVGAVAIKKTREFNPLQLLAWFAVIGAQVLWLGTWLLEDKQIAMLKAGEPSLMASAILYSAFGASLIGHTSYYWLLQRLPLSVMAPTGLLATLLAIIFAIIFLQERLTPSVLIGGCMVILGVGVIVFRNAHIQDTAKKTSPSS